MIVAGCCWVKANSRRPRWRNEMRVFTYQSVSYHFDRLFTLSINVTLPFLKGFLLFAKGTFHFCVFFRSFYPFKKGFARLSPVSPFLSDKDVTLICFMDIKFHPVQKLAAIFLFKTFKDFFLLSSEFLKLCRLKVSRVLLLLFAKKAINKQTFKE